MRFLPSAALYTIRYAGLDQRWRCYDARSRQMDLQRCGITPALLIMGIACALLFIAVLLIITHLLRKEPAHAAEPAKPAPAPKVYVPSGDIVLGGRNEDDDEENL